MKQILCDDEELQQLLTFLPPELDITKKIKNALNRKSKDSYKPKKGVLFQDVIGIRFYADYNPLEVEFKTQKIRQVRDHSKTLCECIDGRNYYIKIPKKHIFKYRWQARLFGYNYIKDQLDKKLLILKKQDTIDKYRSKLQSIERKIHLIEDYPEKFI